MLDVNTSNVAYLSKIKNSAKDAQNSSKLCARYVSGLKFPYPYPLRWDVSIALRTNNEPRCKGFKVKRQSFTYFGVVQSKELSNNDLAVVDLDAVAIICAET